VANKWEVDAIFNNREMFEAAIVVECNKRVSKWFEVSQLRTNIVPPPSLQDAIESKTKAIQQAQAEEQKALTAEAEAKKKIAIAKGDSAQLVINASSKAKAMELEQQKLTPLYIKYLEVQKWNGIMPTTVLSDGAGVMINK
jgi:regulator of protease activity HflC (stomatin/prohibitin superfamily)